MNPATVLILIYHCYTKMFVVYCLNRTVSDLVNVYKFYYKVYLTTYSSTDVYKFSARVASAQLKSNIKCTNSVQPMEKYSYIYKKFIKSDL